MKVEEPLFMKNSEWYYFDEENICYKLTDKAPPDAVKSYKEFYKDIKFVSDRQEDKPNDKV